MSLRTQHILAYETGVRRTADPLGGSYYVEWLTDCIEEQVREYLGKIEERGGCLGVLDSGWLESDLAASAYRIQREIESGDRPLVGVNFMRRDAPADSDSVGAFALRPESEAEQIHRLREVRAGRDDLAVGAALERLREVAELGANTIPALLEAVKAYASIGQICDVLKGVWGEAEAGSWGV
jgi:methylmalonyl-CoA mutase N-terminal domain/subunit